MFNDSSDFRHERLERLIWIDGNFVDFFGAGATDVIQQNVFPIFSKEKRCGRLDILAFSIGNLKQHIASDAVKNQKNRNHLQISLYKVR